MGSGGEGGRGGGSAEGEGEQQGEQGGGRGRRRRRRSGDGGGGLRACAANVARLRSILLGPLGPRLDCHCSLSESDRFLFRESIHSCTREGRAVEQRVGQSCKKGGLIEEKRRGLMPKISRRSCVSPHPSLARKAKKRRPVSSPSMRRLKEARLLLILIALISLLLSSCSSATSLSSRVRNWLHQAGKNDADGNDNDGSSSSSSSSSWPKKKLFFSSSFPFSFLLRPRPTALPLRVWIDAFGLAKGEATIMLEEIEVRKREGTEGRERREAEKEEP